MNEDSDHQAQDRKAILDLGDRLGNVSEACRQAGIPRSAYYQYRRRFEAEGVAGLRNRSPRARSHPLTTPKATEDKLVALSRAHPSWGCVRLTNHLRASGTLLSAPTAQKLLTRHKLGTARDRWLDAEEMAERGPAAASAEQLAWIDSWNPAFRERDRETSRPGELVLQDVRSATRAARVYVHFAVDAFGGLAFASLCPTRDTADAVALFAQDMAPGYRALRQRLESIVTPDVPLFWGSARHPFEAALEAAGVDHRAAHAMAARENGLLERFWRDFQIEFVAPRRADWLTAPFGRWQEEFVLWLADYNQSRPYLGYRNHGAPPLAFARTCT